MTSDEEPRTAEPPLTRATLRRQRNEERAEITPPIIVAAVGTAQGAEPTGALPDDRAESEASEPPPVGASVTPAIRRSRRGRSAGRRLLAIGAAAAASSFAIGMTVPSAVVGGPNVDPGARFSAAEPATTAELTSDDDIQAFVVPGDIPSDDLERESEFAVSSAADLAAVAGIRHFTGTVLADPEAAFQWPFPVSVPTSSNFGPRWGRQHEGADFTPGEGAEIQAIADGVVRIATEQGGAFGVTVYIEHEVDGRTVFSRYAHMQYGSLGVREGERVVAGQKVGRVGNTGRSFGAHLHLEIVTDEGKVDPVAWLGQRTGT